MAVTCASHPEFSAPDPLHTTRLLRANIRHHAILNANSIISIARICICKFSCHHASSGSPQATISIISQL
jgi:hypothetical protein